MKKLLLELINKYTKQIVADWLEKLKIDLGGILSDSQLRTFVETSMRVIKEVIESGDYKIADQYLIDAYNLFSKVEVNLLQISEIFHHGRNSLLNCVEKDKSHDLDPVILLRFLDEIIEQIYARYGMLHQNAQMKELTKDRDRLAKKLEMNQLYLKNILHNSETAIAVIDENEIFTDWNAGAVNMFGFNEKEVIGKPSSLLLPDVDKFSDELMFIKSEVLKSGDVKILDTQRKRKDGRIIPVELNVAKLPSGNGEYVGRTVIIKDKSHVKELQQQIDQSEKLAVIGQLAAGVAHEIGNPLASISSLVQLIQRRNKDEILNEQLITIKENIDRISKIVRELVDFSRPPSYEKAFIQVTEVINTAVGIVKYDKRVKNVNFETDLDPNLPLIRIVPDQLLQVFVNILINALDAIEGEGTVGVRSYQEDDYTCVRISDDGCGMEKKVIEKIFDPFFTTKTVGKGTGLGLSVSYGIIKNFQGDILVKSEVEKGSIFTIKLPVMSQNSSE